MQAIYLHKYGQKPARGAAAVSTYSRQVRLHFKAFIPNTLHSHWSDAPWFDGPISLPLGNRIAGDVTDQFKSDGRGFFKQGTSRLHSWADVTITSDGKPRIGQTGHHIDETHKRTKLTSIIYGTKYSPIEKKTASYEGLREVVHNPIKITDFVKVPGMDDLASVEFVGQAKMPFYPSAITPAIDYNVTYFVAAKQDSTLEVSAVGHHDRFPGYEAYIECDGLICAKLYYYDPEKQREYEPNLFNLNQNISFRTKVTTIKRLKHTIR